MRKKNERRRGKIPQGAQRSRSSLQLKPPLADTTITVATRTIRARYVPLRFQIFCWRNHKIPTITHASSKIKLHRFAHVSLIFCKFHLPLVN